MITQEEHKNRYDIFIKEFGLAAHRRGRRLKLSEEYSEYCNTDTDTQEEIDELTDVFNCVTSLLWSLGVDDVLQAGIDKLDATSIKYRG